MSNFAYRHKTAVHIFKTMLAVTIGWYILTLFNFQKGPWILVTIAVVMCAQPHVGATMQQSYMRAIGTVTGVLASLIPLIFFPNHHLYMTFYLLVGVGCYTWFAMQKTGINNVGVFGTVTMAVLLGSKVPDINSALERGLDISIGLVVAVLVSKFVFPLEARIQYRMLVSDTLFELEKLFLAQAVMEFGLDETQTTREYQEKITKSFIDQQTLLKDGVHENKNFRAKVRDFEALMTLERKLFRHLNHMFYTLQHSFESYKLIHQIPLYESIVDKVNKLMISEAEIALSFETIPVERFTELKQLQQEFIASAQEQAELYERKQLVGFQAFLLCIEVLVDKVIAIGQRINLLNENTPEKFKKRNIGLINI